MVRTFFLSVLFFFAFGCTQAQTTVNDSFVHEGIVRTYSFYVPASYVPGQAVPLIIDLHGYSSNGATHAQRSNFEAIADTANFIVAHPDGTFEPFTNQRFWNYANILGSTVNDLGFLEALIDTLAAHYTINPARIYSSGMSNGSFMCYLLACESDRFAAIGAVTGSMGVNMYNACTPLHPIPTLHIHGTSDPINPYTGTSSMKAIEEVTAFWVNQNGCNTTPVVTPIPDIQTSDNATAERYLYSGGINGNTVELFKVTDGGHTWPGYYVFNLFNGNTCMDFSASKELWRFFSQHARTDVTATENPLATDVNLWPNPSPGLVYIEPGNYFITDVTILDIQGRLVEKQSGTNITFLDLHHLAPGNYTAHLSGKDFQAVKKLVIAAED